MSGQRARKFCRLCQGYGVVVERVGKENSPALPYLKLRDDAMSQAMQAAEGVEDPNEILGACEDCDYKSPKIAELLERKKGEPEGLS